MTTLTELPYSSGEKLYASYDSNYIVTFIGTEFHKNNSDPTIPWVEITEAHGTVQVGYRYLPRINSFEEVIGTLFEEKQKLSSYVDTVYTKKMKAMLSGYTTEEIQTFYIQHMEVNSYYESLKDKDRTVSLTFLRAVANYRGVSLDILLEKAKSKVDTFAFYAGAVTGVRQKFEDAISAATDYPDLKLIRAQVDYWNSQEISS